MGRGLQRKAILCVFVQIMTFNAKIIHFLLDKWGGLD